MEQMNYDMLLLKNQLCFPIYACSREVIKAYKPLLDQLGLTYTQYITMLVLWEHRSLTVKELGNALYLDSGTLTPLLKKLEEKGLVTRKRSALDERNLIVTITPSGERLREQAVELPQKLAQSVNLTQEESLTLYNLLYKILQEPETSEE